MNFLIKKISNVLSKAISTWALMKTRSVLSDNIKVIVRSASDRVKEELKIGKNNIVGIITSESPELLHYTYICRYNTQATI